MIKKEFYLPNKNKLSLYNISYLDEDFILVTDKISRSLGNTIIDVTDRIIPSSVEGKRRIVLKDNSKSTHKRAVYPKKYRYYLEEDPFIKRLVSINSSLEEINFKAIDNFLEKNNQSEYLDYLREYLQIFNFEYLDSFSLEDFLKKELKELERNRDFCKVERYLDQKYFLEVAINASYRRKEENAIANKKVLVLGDKVVE